MPKGKIYFCKMRINALIFYAFSTILANTTDYCSKRIYTLWFRHLADWINITTFATKTCNTLKHYH